MKTIESLDGTVYEIAIDGHEIMLMAPGHTLTIKIIGDFDSENIEKYIDANFHRAVRTNHDEDLSLVELIDYFNTNNFKP